MLSLIRIEVFHKAISKKICKVQTALILQAIIYGILNKRVRLLNEFLIGLTVALMDKLF